ncbi:pentapeptide repeat-containing protein [Azospirillum thermophilum]|uniref:Pentapeptide repeat-containing protein n=1 Tax=Azospirillum thermophilum TaxID=2202148 RepID=A0A2S2CQB1_9PROT|nr:pentapeptide repeat-containing protein [Azospirillum thermophilum]AWK86662.1 hypothetical protein DEW08_10805 [Azospirillum thermophilum]
MPPYDLPSDVAPKPAPPHPAADSAGLDKLEAALNDLSKAAAAQSLTYLLLWIYLIFTVTAVTDYDLLVEKPIKLPVFDLEVGLVKFFIGAPALFWLVQLYMVRKVAVIADAIRHYLTFAEREAAKSAGNPGAVLEALRHRVDGFVITRLLARFEAVRCGDGSGPATPPLPQALTVLAAAVTLVLAPVLLHGAFQIRFLAYQSEGITWWHRLCLMAGLALSAATAREAGLTWEDTLRALRAMLVGLFGGLVPRGAAQPKGKDGGRLDWASRRLAAMVASAILAVSLLVATTPGEFLSDGVVIEGSTLGDWLTTAGLPRTLKPRAPHTNMVAAQPGGGDTAGTIVPGPLPLNLSHRDFSGRSLRRAQLSGANLKGAVFRGANLQGADLSDAQLQSALIRETNLNDANLSSADMDGVIVYRSQMVGADMNWVNLQKSKIYETDLSKADIANANLQKCQITESTLQGANLASATLDGGNLVQVNLKGATFSDASLRKVGIYDAQMQGSDLSNAKLQGAEIFNAFLQLSDFSFAQMPGADLSRAHLEGANFFKANLMGANLSRAVLHGAYLYRSDLRGANLSGSQLQGADFSESHLQGASLDGAATWKTRAHGANITAVHFRNGAELQNEWMEEDLGYQIIQWIDQTPDKKILTPERNPSHDFYLRSYRILEFMKQANDSFGGISFHDYLQIASKAMTPTGRSVYMTDLACNVEDGDYVLKATILRLVRSDYQADAESGLTAWPLAAGIADSKGCPAAAGLSDSDRDFLDALANR